MGNRQWGVGNGEEKKEEESVLGEKSGEQGALTPALSPGEREEDDEKRREERPPPSAGQTPPPSGRGRGKKEVTMGLAASSLVESEVGWFGRVGNVPFLVLIRVYRVVLSPVIGGQCRFEPTCSVYSMEAYRLYGPLVGTRMTVGRICRCHPWNDGGFDPVPLPGDDEELGIRDGCSEMREGD